MEILAGTEVQCTEDQEDQEDQVQRASYIESTLRFIQTVITLKILDIKNYVMGKKAVQ